MTDKDFRLAVLKYATTTMLGFGLFIWVLIGLCAPSPKQACYQRNFKALESRAGQGNLVPSGAFENIRNNCDLNPNYNL